MFYVIILLILGAFAYTLWHVWCILPLAKWCKWAVVALLAAAFFSMFMLFGGMMERLPLNTATVAYEVATSMPFILLYLVMVFLVLDLLRLFHLLPATYFHENWAATLCITGLLVVVFAWGNIRYKDKVRVPLTLTTDKPLAKEYKMVMMSDLHLGYHNRRAELARWVDLVNAEKPDLILIAGDIIDISVRPLLEENMAEEFHRLKAPAYACMGNHEYFSSEPRARQFFQDAHIHLLSDEMTSIDSCLCIIGRDDRTNPSRKEVDVLTRNLPENQYSILLDHQPYQLELAEQCGIDFQLSGHTHRGQVWPISWITDAIYECSWGPWLRGHTRYYVSSGIGIWGGKYRIGTQSEYVVATLKGK